MIVLPAAALTTEEQAGGAVERHGDMAWVKVR